MITDIFEYYGKDLLKDLHREILNRYPQINGELVVVDKPFYKEVKRKLGNLEPLDIFFIEQRLKYSDYEAPEAIIPIDSQSVIVLTLEKCIEDVPLLINADDHLVSFISKWRMGIGK